MFIYFFYNVLPMRLFEFMNQYCSTWASVLNMCWNLTPYTIAPYNTKETTITATEAIINLSSCGFCVQEHQRLHRNTQRKPNYPTQFLPEHCIRPNYITHPPSYTSTPFSLAVGLYYRCEAMWNICTPIPFTAPYLQYVQIRYYDYYE